MSDEIIRVTLDSVAYTSKPSQYVKAITNRMKQAGPTELTRAEFCEALRRGQTWSGGTFEPSRGEWGAFLGEQIFALDFDNDAVVYGADGKPVLDAEGHKLKRPLMPHEKMFLGIPDALRRCDELGLPLLCVYTSMRHKPKWPKYRLVFDAGEVITDHQAARDTIATLREMFPQCDQSITKPNRLFFGSTEHGVKECWREGAPDES